MCSGTWLGASTAGHSRTRRRQGAAPVLRAQLSAAEWPEQPAKWPDRRRPQVWAAQWPERHWPRRLLDAEWPERRRPQLWAAEWPERHWPRRLLDAEWPGR